MTWKNAVMPTAIMRTGIVPSTGVTVTIGVVRGTFVKAQSQISSTTKAIAWCWYNTIVLSALVHNLGWVEKPSSRPVPVNVVVDVSFVSVHCAPVVVGNDHHFCWRWTAGLVAVSLVGYVAPVSGVVLTRAVVLAEVEHVLTERQVVPEGVLPHQCPPSSVSGHVAIHLHTHTHMHMCSTFIHICTKVRAVGIHKTHQMGCVCSVLHCVLSNVKRTLNLNFNMKLIQLTSPLPPLHPVPACCLTSCTSVSWPTFTALFWCPLPQPSSRVTQ